MDIKRDLPGKPRWRQYWYVLPVGLVILLAVVVKTQIGSASYFINKDDIQLAEVVAGDFRVDVRGVGVLKPQNIRWVSAQVSGRVEQLLVKPGARVDIGDALAQLSNPQLHSDLEKARWELEATKAESHAAYVALESQLVDLENSVVEAQYNHKSTRLKLDAETELLKQGRASVSMLDYQRTQLSVEQQWQRLLAQEQRVVKMKANLDASKTAHQARTGLVANNYQRLKAQVSNLTVRASTPGVIQQVSLELGQQVNTGGNVALIADQQVLLAQLQVQELQISEIAIGQPVMVDTRSSKIPGMVSRIDPAVDGGMVQVDVALTGQLPKEARPDLNVEGLIQVSHIKNTLYVRRPVFAPRFTRADFFKLSPEGNQANKQKVQLGQSSINRIQILDGLAAGDTIIISDTTAWQQHLSVLIN